MKRRALAITTLLAGCAASLGPAALIGTDAELVGVKLVRPGLQGRSCRVSVLGVPFRAGAPALSEAVAQILAADPEGNVVTRAEVTWSELVTGHLQSPLRGSPGRPRAHGIDAQAAGSRWPRARVSLSSTPSSGCQGRPRVTEKPPTTTGRTRCCMVARRQSRCWLSYSLSGPPRPRAQRRTPW